MITPDISGMLMRGAFDGEKMHLEASIEESLEMFELEHKQEKRLKKAGMSPRRRILLSGPPGNGKSTLAALIAHRLGVPFFKVEQGSIVDSHLGGTGANISKLKAGLNGFRGKSVVLWDEFDGVAQSRSFEDVGEMKRVVGSLLNMVDELPENIIFVVASNFTERFDEAMLRRFDMRLHLGPPTLFEALDFCKSWLGEDVTVLYSEIENRSWADLCKLRDQYRRYRILKPKSEPVEGWKHSVAQIFDERIKTSPPPRMITFSVSELNKLQESEGLKS